MSDLADRIGGWAAERVMRWIAARAEGTHREWVAAMRAEMACMDEGVERLRWTLGGVPMAWRMGKGGRAPREAFALRASRNLAALAIFAILLRFWPRFFPMVNGSMLPSISLALVGVAVGVRLRARAWTMAMLGGFVAMATFTIAARAGAADSVMSYPGQFFIWRELAPWVAASVAAWGVDRLGVHRRRSPRAWSSTILLGIAAGEFAGMLLPTVLASVRSGALSLLAPSLAVHLSIVLCAGLGALCFGVLRGSLDRVSLRTSPHPPDTRSSH